MKRSLLLKAAVVAASVMMSITSYAGTWVKMGTEWAYTQDYMSFKDGWIQDSGKIYYVDPANKLMVKGWRNIDGIFYLFGTDGALIQDVYGNQYHRDFPNCMSGGYHSPCQNDACRIGADNAYLMNGNIKLNMNYSGNQYWGITENKSTDELSKEVFDLVNAYRIANGKTALKADSTLDDVAMKRAEELSRNYSHMRPDGTKCFTLYKQNGYYYSAAGENIAFGQTSASDVFYTWINSQRHRNNMLGDYDEMGVGVYEANGVYYWTQDYGTKLKI